MKIDEFSFKTETDPKFESLNRNYTIYPPSKLNKTLNFSFRKNATESIVNIYFFKWH